MGLTFPKSDYVPVCFRGFFVTKKRGLFLTDEASMGEYGKELESRQQH